ncbi:MAG TPA: hypothetical protein DDY13_15955 [Cytophagales bacterium]|jgi:cadmium resistance protein CadD (predicted permease)|nr:hypothetical protein [Cytophagales bacterium]
MKQTALKFGVAAGVINAVLMFALMSFWKEDQNFQMGELLGYASMVLALSMVFFGVRYFRNEHNTGSITFGKAFAVGLGIVLVASLIYVVGWFVYSRLIDPGMMDQYFETGMQAIRESDIDESAKAEKLEEMERYRSMYQNPLIEAGMTFLEIFPVGLLASLIAAVVYKKRPPEQK